MNLHFCHVCKEIRDTADGFCVMCHSFLAPTIVFTPTKAISDWFKNQPDEDSDA